MGRIMAIELSKNRLGTRQIQVQKKNIPLEQIIAVQGQNPLAMGIQEAGNVIGKTLQNRAELRRQGEQLAKLEQLGGATPGAYAGLDPTMVDNFVQTNIKRKADLQDQANKAAQDIIKVRALEKQFGYKTGELGDDHAAALLKVQFDNQEKLRNTGVAQEAQQRLKEQFLDKQVNKYSTQLEKTGVPNAINTAENVLNLLPERGEDVPGYGTLDWLRPNILAGDRGREMRQAVSQLFNIELKTRSGAAVVDNELKRLKDEYGQGGWGTEEALRTGIRQYIERVKELARNIDAGFDPEVKQTYEDQGGRNNVQTLESFSGLKKIERAGPKAISVFTGKKKSLADKLGL